MSLSPDWVQVVVGWFWQVAVILPDTGDCGYETHIISLLHTITAGSLIISEGVAIITYNKKNLDDEIFTFEDNFQLNLESLIIIQVSQ